jgi:hypothetical protein
LLSTGPYNEGAVQTAGITDITIGRIYFEEEMITRDLNVIVIQAKVGVTACVVPPQQEVVRFTELKLFALLWPFYDCEKNSHGNLQECIYNNQTI